MKKGGGRKRKGLITWRGVLDSGGMTRMQMSPE